MNDHYCIYCMNPLSGPVCGSCGKRQSDYIPAPHHLRPGTLLNGRYLTGRVLGEGGFGITYIGKDTKSGLSVAVKEYYPSAIVSRSPAVSDSVAAVSGSAEELLEKGKTDFLREAKTLALFSQDPGIVSIRDFFRGNNTAYLVMDYVEGETLEEYLRKAAPLSFSRTVDMLLPVLDSLEKIHGQNLIHRDISPSNMMVRKDGSVLLLDFGSAVSVDEQNEKSLSGILKPGYAPEEQYRSKGRQGPFTDVYGLSATMYKMLTGITPEESMNRLFSDDLESIRSFNPSVTEKQEAVILKGLAVMSKDRWQSVREFRDALISARTDAAAEKPLAEKPLSDNPSSEKPSSDYPSSENPSSDYPSSDYPSSDKPSSDYPSSDKLSDSKKKPSIPCFIIGLCFLSGFLAFLAAARFLADNSVDIITYCLCAFGCLCASAFFGSFFYPRLTRKNRKRSFRVFAVLFALLIVFFTGSIVYTNITAITFGNRQVSPNETRLTFSSDDQLTNQDIPNLSRLKNLTSLSIVNRILDDEDMKYLAQLSSLKTLSLSGNINITDISPLQSLTNLTTLSLSDTSVSDISCLSGLKNLKTLNINGTKVQDLSVLRELPELTILEMNNLENLDESSILLPESLTSVSCVNNNLTSLSFLASAAKNLTFLDAESNRITDISALKDAENLKTLRLSFNEISDISSLAGKEELTTLQLSENLISDISPLNQDKAVTELFLESNRITDISPLKGHADLTTLGLTDNLISDISPLEDCDRIATLFLRENRILDPGPLRMIDDLAYVDLGNNQISDISFLKDCTGLMNNTTLMLYLGNNDITDISPLSSFRGNGLDLAGNRITDVSPLSSCENLNLLDLADNDITDVSSIIKNKKLNSLHLERNPINSLDVFGYSKETLNEALFETFQLSLSYSETIDWERLFSMDNLSVIVYDATTQQKSALLTLFSTFHPGSSRYYSLNFADSEEETT